jgi:glucosamine--fructose-6-phosphate aminotransferase (isomerizing)
MCGIVGAISKRNVVPILLEGLRRLEYRGYDSAGVAVINGSLQRLRSTGRVAERSALHTRVGQHTARLQRTMPIPMYRAASRWCITAS